MNELTINLHTASETPLYEQIYQHIKREIQEGRITSGEKLPSSRSLCKYLEVSRSTVELAYEQLISEGYVEAVPCKGYFAAELEGMYRLDVVPALVGAEEKTEKKEWKYNFTPNGVDLNSFPYNVWRRLAKDSLLDDRAEMFRLGDMAYVLKDGAMVKKLMLKETNQDELIKAMVGRDASNFYQKGSFSSGDRALEAVHYSGNGIVRDVSFSVSRGEVFGLGGLVGAGRTELVRMIYGADKRDSGTLTLDGKDITPTTPKSAVKRGVFLVSEDRKGEGLFLRREGRSLAFSAAEF